MHSDNVLFMNFLYLKKNRQKYKTNFIDILKDHISNLLASFNVLYNLTDIRKFSRGDTQYN